MLKGGGGWEDDDEDVADGGRGVLEGLPEDEATATAVPGAPTVTAEDEEDEGNV